ncbi:hypothetical protein QBC44DRAFT_302996 [Cladorrhinum sp. PSN332]|nr:hypothetical protein QBC44DRAFT_302996 [Cladorrhinum sp. PSN332]
MLPYFFLLIAAVCALPQNGAAVPGGCDAAERRSSGDGKPGNSLDKRAGSGRRYQLSTVGNYGGAGSLVQVCDNNLGFVFRAGKYPSTSGQASSNPENQDDDGADDTTAANPQSAPNIPGIGAIVLGRAYIDTNSSSGPLGGTAPERPERRVSLTAFQTPVAGNTYHTEHVFELHIIKDFFVWLVRNSNQNPPITCDELARVFNVRDIGIYEAGSPTTLADELMLQLAWHDTDFPEGIAEASPSTARLHSRLGHLYVLEASLNLLKGRIMNGRPLDEANPLNAMLPDPTAWLNCIEILDEIHAVTEYIHHPAVVLTWRNATRSVRAYLADSRIESVLQSDRNRNWPQLWETFVKAWVEKREADLVAWYREKADKCFQFVINSDILGNQFNSDEEELDRFMDDRWKPDNFRFPPDYADFTVSQRERGFPLVDFQTNDCHRGQEHQLGRLPGRPTPLWLPKATTRINAPVQMPTYVRKQKQSFLPCYNLAGICKAFLPPWEASWASTLSGFLSLGRGPSSAPTATKSTGLLTQRFYCNLHAELSRVGDLPGQPSSRVLLLGRLDLQDAVSWRCPAISVHSPRGIPYTVTEAHRTWPYHFPPHRAIMNPTASPVSMGWIGPHPDPGQDSEQFQPERPIPRFLFRITSPSSHGVTTTTCVKPHASLGGTRQLNFMNRRPDDAAQLLQHHLRWFKTTLGETSNLVTWTSDLHWGLNLALQHNSSGNLGGGTPLQQIRILMLDTSGIEHRFSKWTLGDLVPLRKGEKGDWKKGDYLSQGELIVGGRCVETTMERIVGAGLYDLYPEIETEWRVPTSDRDEIGKRVKSLRVKFGTRWRETAESDVQTALNIGRCFAHDQDDGRTLYVTVMVLGFARRGAGDDLIFDGLEHLVNGDSNIGALVTTSQWSPDELKRAKDIMSGLHEYCNGPQEDDDESVDSLGRDFASLGL